MENNKFYAVYEEFEEERFNFEDIQFFKNKEQALIEANRLKDELVAEGWKLSDFDEFNFTETNTCVLLEDEYSSEAYVCINEIEFK